MLNGTVNGTATKAPEIYLPDGSVWEHPAREAEKHTSLEDRFEVARSFTSYLEQLASLSLDPQTRAVQPSRTHPWVWSAQRTIASTMQQLPFVPMVETDEQTDRRRSRVQRAGGTFRPGKGFRRNTAEHLLWAHRWAGYSSRALEPVPEHWVGEVMRMPTDEIMGQSQRMWMTASTLSLYGEAYWIKQRSPGVRLNTAGRPGALAFAHPRNVTPEVRSGKLIGYRVHAGDDNPSLRQVGSAVTYSVDEVIPFRLSDPEHPLKGMSPIAAVAAGIELDLLNQAYARSLARKGGLPAGVLMHDSSGGSIDTGGDGKTSVKKQADDLMDSWNDRFTRPGNAGGIATLWGGWKFEAIGQKLGELLPAEQSKITREMVLASMGVPKPFANATDDVNRATAQVLERIFWEVTLLPLVRLIELTLDATLMFEEPDSVMAMFDLSGVRALKSDRAEAVEAAGKAITTARIPPADAYEMFDIPVQRYEGDDVVLVGLAQVPLSDIVNPEPPPAAPVPPSDPDDDDDDDDDDGNDPVEAALRFSPDTVVRQARVRSGFAARAGRHTLSVLRSPKIWQAFVTQLEEPGEKVVSKAWTRYIARQKRVALEKFDEVAGTGKSKAARTAQITRVLENPEDVLPELAEMQADLASAIRPVHSVLLDGTFDFVAGEIGVTLLDPDDPGILAFVQLRRDRLAGTAPVTIQNQYRASILEGIENSETVQELRKRVVEVYNGQVRPAKTLMVARTESAGFINGVRHELQRPFSKVDWITAGDENVRDSHVTFGAADPVEYGFNYLELVGGGGGTLRYPGDIDGPAGEVINCRCVQVPA